MLRTLTFLPVTFPPLLAAFQFNPCPPQLRARPSEGTPNAPRAQHPPVRPPQRPYQPLQRLRIVSRPNPAPESHTHTRASPVQRLASAYASVYCITYRAHSHTRRTPDILRFSRSLVKPFPSLSRKNQVNAAFGHRSPSLPWTYPHPTGRVSR